MKGLNKLIGDKVIEKLYNGGDKLEKGDFEEGMYLSNGNSIYKVTRVHREQRSGNRKTYIHTTRSKMEVNRATNTYRDVTEGVENCDEIPEEVL